MKPERQRVVIAELCGWVRDEKCDCWRNPNEGPYAIAFVCNTHVLRQIPDYLNDLNAMHEACKTLDPMQKVQAQEWLTSMVYEKSSE